MRIKIKIWLIYLFLASISVIYWFTFSFPLISNINLSVNRHQALSIAKDHLIQQHNTDSNKFRNTIVFVSDYYTDDFLQSSIGFEAEKEFLKKHDYQMFHWVIRFFQENQKEEYIVSVSCATGEVTAFSHKIAETASRKKISRDLAKERVVEFLSQNFGFVEDEYYIKGDLKTEYDNRIDYRFSWIKKSVNIPWDKDKSKGTAKLVTGATISGDEILSFSKHKLAIPEEYNRHMDRQKNIGRNLMTVVRFFHVILFVGAIFFVILRRNHLAMHMTKKFYISIAVFLYVLIILSDLNFFAYTMHSYNTTQPLNSFLARHFVHLFVNTLFVAIGIMLPGLSGETLNFEMFPEKKEGRFLHYIRTTFFSRKTFELICLGYLCALIMIGIQAVAFELGRQHLGVRLDHKWLIQSTSAYVPFLAAFTLGFKASIFEELLFRLFAISWLKKYLKSTLLAVLLSSLLWGFGHSSYLVFPMWFRGLEVTLMGFFLSFIYLRYGIITVIVAHYIFDVFWASVGHLFGTTHSWYFSSSIGVLFVPMAYGIAAFVLNQSKEEKPLQWCLSKLQLFNLDVLSSHLMKLRQSNIFPPNLKADLIKHGWDKAVVDIAFEDGDNWDKNSLPKEK